MPSKHNRNSNYKIFDIKIILENEWRENYNLLYTASGSRLRYFDTSQLEDQHEETYYFGSREYSEEDSIIGIYDAALQNDKYIDLLYKLKNKSSELSWPKEVHQIWWNWWIRIRSLFWRTSNPFKWNSKTSHTWIFYFGKSKDDISRNIKINKDSMNFGIRYFRKCLRIRRKCNINLLNKKAKLKDSHLEFIESLIRT